jgi:hypothetical protein
MVLDVVRSKVLLARSGIGQSQPTCMIVEDQTLIGFSLEAYLVDWVLLRSLSGRGRVWNV